MPATKVNANLYAPAMAIPEIERTKTQLKTLASAGSEGPGHSHFLDVYLLELIRLREAFPDEDSDIS